MAPGAKRRGCPGGGRLVAARWPAFLRVSVEQMCFRFTKTSGRGVPPGPPQRHSARHKEATRHGLSPEARPEPGLRGCRPRPPRPVLRGDAEQPGGQLVGERVLRRLKAALDTLLGPRLRGPSVGCSSRRRGGGDLRGSEGARPPASLRRGRTECGHGGYAGSPALAASDKPVTDVSETRFRLPSTRLRSTPASAPANPFNGPREARPAAGWRPSIPGRPCTREAGAATDPRQAPPGGGRGHQFRRGLDQPELLVSSSLFSFFFKDMSDIRQRLAQ